MSAPTKRRHVSYYLSLPLVAVIVFLAVAQLAALQRADMVADLADRVAHQDADEATAALRHLAAMPRPPLEILVSAATSSDQAIAKEAQYLISDLLRRWQRQVETDRRVGAVAAQLHQLATALEKQQMTFSTADHVWVRNTARGILRLANQMPSDKSPLVAAHCDTVLAAVTAGEMSSAAFVDRQLAVASQPVTPVMSSASAESTSEVMQREQPELAAFAVPPLTTVGTNEAIELPAPADEQSVAPAEQGRGSAIPMEENQTTRVLRWTHPMFHGVPAMPIHAAPLEAADERSLIPRPQSKPVAKEPPVGNPLADLDSHELLARWLHADGGEVFPLEEELTRRGFGRLSDRLVEQLFSDDMEERLRLVDDVLTEPGVDARPWLVLLAEDSAADVRLLAVTIMATSDDAALIDKAWHVAIHDRDPRIAGLAGRLRERRENLQRR